MNFVNASSGFEKSARDLIKMNDLVERLWAHGWSEDDLPVIGDTIVEIEQQQARIKELETALWIVVDSVYCNDGYRNVSISEAAEQVAKQALAGEPNDE